MPAQAVASSTLRSTLQIECKKTHMVDLSHIPSTSFKTEMHISVLNGVLRYMG